MGVANGSISGARHVYDLGRTEGVVAALLDSTWALTTTGPALVAHAVAAVMRDAGFLPELSERRNVHVYRRGLQLRRGFAVTIGNVIGGAGDVERPSRRRLIEDHEVVHVWQARWLGPFFPVLYGGWSLVGAIYGAAEWVTRRRDRRFGKVVEAYSYYCNPIEWWAYSRAGTWRPSKMEDGCGWRTPMVGPLPRVLARTQATA